MFISGSIAASSALYGARLLMSGANLTSVTHNFFATIKVRPDTGANARLVLSAVALWMYWSNPVAGVVAQLAIRTLFAGAQMLKSGEADFIYETTSKGQRITTEIFKNILFPLKMYDHMHEIAGAMALPASIIGCFAGSQVYAEGRSQPIHVTSDPKLRESGEDKTLLVNGSRVSVHVVRSGQKVSRWFVVANPNAALYEQHLMQSGSHRFKSSGKLYPIPQGHIYALANKLNANILFFNYPSVGLSEGMPSRHSMIESQRAVWRFAEEKLEAQEIINYGWSIGGGVQGEAIAGFEFKEGVKVASIKDRTFSSMAAAARGLMGPFIARGATLLGWNINTLAGGLEGDVVIQTGQKPCNDPRCTYVHTVESDGMITADAALESALDGVEHTWVDLETVQGQNNHMCSLPDEDVDYYVLDTANNTLAPPKRNIVNAVAEAVENRLQSL